MNRVPTNVEEATSILRDCTKAGRRVYIRGKMGEKPGRPPGSPLPYTGYDHEAVYGRGDPGGRPGNALVLSTSALRGIVAHAPEDMYVAVGAGTTLAEAQRFLAEHNQQVPLASPWLDTTIGELVAANRNAPLRMRYGAIRDLVLCATVVLADGRVIRAGRPVIKNVAGYDLVKLFIGARGTLGLLADITLKVTGLPRARRSLIVPLDDLRHGLMWARQLYPLSLAASAIVLVSSGSILETIQQMPGDGSMRYVEDALKGRPYALMYTAEGLVEDVQAELRQAHEELRASKTVRIKAMEPVEIDGVSGTDAWSHFLGQAGDAMHLRVGLPVRDLPVYVQDQAALLIAGSFLVDFGSGFIYCLLPARDDDQLARTIEQLRAPALQAGGYAIVTHVPEGWSGRLERWGYRPDTLDVMRRLKARWDPAGILNAGEFVV
jgi:D-lactate dehydrogenase (cytochrome)